MTGHHKYANGWTVSVITHGYGSPEAPYEVYAWHEDGRTDPERGWQTTEQVEAYLAEVEARPRDPIAPIEEYLAVWAELGPSEMLDKKQGRS